MNQTRAVHSRGTGLLLLAWGIIWRMTLWGLGAGALLGVLYGCAWVFFAGGLYGLGFGALFGFGSGLLCGIVMVPVTLIALPRVRAKRGYAERLGFVPVCVILAFLLITLGEKVASDWNFYRSFHGPLEFVGEEWTRVASDRFELLIYYLPGLISLVPAWFAGRSVARWADGQLPTTVPETIS